MSKLNEIFDNCPDGAVVMMNGTKYVYAKGKEQVSNNRSFGYKVTNAPVSAPVEVADANDGPLVSSDVNAKEAVAMIEENDVQFLEGFLVDGEKRKLVLKAAEAKRNEPIKTVE